MSTLVVLHLCTHDGRAHIEVTKIVWNFVNKCSKCRQNGIRSWSVCNFDFVRLVAPCVGSVVAYSCIQATSCKMRTGHSRMKIRPPHFQRMKQLNEQSEIADISGSDAVLPALRTFIHKVSNIFSHPYMGTTIVCRGGTPPTCTQILERRLNLSRS